MARTVTLANVAELEDGVRYAVSLRNVRGVFSHVDADGARRALATSSRNSALVFTPVPHGHRTSITADAGEAAAFCDEDGCGWRGEWHHDDEGAPDAYGEAVADAEQHELETRA